MAEAFAEGLIDAVPVRVTKVPPGAEVLHLRCDVEAGYDRVVSVLPGRQSGVGVARDMSVEDVS